MREKFTCRECEAISQPPAPFHVTPRGFVGPNLLAMILFEKFGQHQPFNRQSERYGREGIDLSVSTLADQVGAATTALAPLHGLIRAHVLAAERLHADETTVPILAKGKTDTGRIWTYVRDDRPFGGSDPPAALYFASRDRRQEHPDDHLAGWRGVLLVARPQRLLRTRRHRGFSAPWLGRGTVSPIALEAVRRVDALFAIERDINGMSAAERHRIRQQQSRPLVEDLHAWLQEKRASLSRSSPVIKPIDYMLKRWTRFATFLDDGRAARLRAWSQELGLRRFRQRRGPCSRHGDADRHCEAQ